VSAIDRLLKRPVTIWRQGPPVTDAYGVEVPGSWEPSPALAYLEQTVTTEVVVGAEVYQADWLLVLGKGVAVAGWDRVEVPDIPATFEVVGVPNRRRRPQSDTEHHVEARLRLVNTGPAPTGATTAPNAAQGQTGPSGGS
jgi:hypothetical protein